MPNDSYYVRIRGKVTGPFDKNGLQKLVRRGTLSRIHEISDDRTTWSSAGEYEDLFPLEAGMGAGALVGAVQAASFASATSYPADPGSSALPASDSARYFYSQSGGAVGPVGLAVLKSLAQNGTLKADDLVWRENAEVGAPAHQLPALSTIYTQPLSYSSPASAKVHPRQRELWEQGRSHLDSTASAVGIAGGAMLVLLLNAPWAVVDGHAVWWWDLYRADHAAGLAATGTWVGLTGAALCIVAPLVRGIARATTYVCLAAALLLFVSVGAFRFNVGTIPGLGLIAPIALAALLGVSIVRPYIPDSMAPRTLLAVCSGVVAVSATSMVLLWITDQPTLSSVSDPIIFGFVLCLIGMLAMLATAVMGFVGLKPRFTPGLNRASIVTALSAIILPEFGGLIAVVGGLSSIPLPWLGEESWFRLSDMRGIVAQALARLIVMWCAVLLVLAIGVAELLVNTCRSEP